MVASSLCGVDLEKKKIVADVCMCLIKGALFDIDDAVGGVKEKRVEFMT